MGRRGAAEGRCAPWMRASVRVMRAMDAGARQGVGPALACAGERVGWGLWVVCGGLGVGVRGNGLG